MKSKDILEFLKERWKRGREKYGEWDVETDTRDYGYEALEEAGDAYNYGQMWKIQAERVCVLCNKKEAQEAQEIRDRIARLKVEQMYVLNETAAIYQDWRALLKREGIELEEKHDH